jgi:nucleoside-diphosphate-sugar epimerase
MRHCCKAKAILVMSTHAVYRPHIDPFHVYEEGDPLGVATTPRAPTYSVSKIAQESVATYCAREFEIPTVIARMNASYGPNGGRPMWDLESVLDGQAVEPKWDPYIYSPIAQDDINLQLEALLSAARVPPLIVNWAGDEPVSSQEWTRYLCKILGIEPIIRTVPVPGSQLGLVADNGLRASITGLCVVTWQEGMLAAAKARFPYLFAS